jgi:hypothetical protein
MKAADGTVDLDAGSFRAVLIAVLSGILIGGSGVGALAYVAAQTNNDRLLILETDTHRITRDFDLGMKMVGDVAAADTDPASRRVSRTSTCRLSDTHKSSRP